MLLTITLATTASCKPHAAAISSMANTVKYFPMKTVGGKRTISLVLENYETEKAYNRQLMADIIWWNDQRPTRMQLFF
jgi:hypothetical protein